METTAEYWHHSQWWSKMPALMVFSLTDHTISYDAVKPQKVILVKCSFTDRMLSSLRDFNSNNELQNKHIWKLTAIIDTLFIWKVVSFTKRALLINRDKYFKIQPNLLVQTAHVVTRTDLLIGLPPRNSAKCQAKREAPLFRTYALKHYHLPCTNQASTC